MAEHLDRKQSAAYRPNESVHGVPGRVEPWNFIGEKFQEIKNAGDGDDPWVSKNLQRLILRRQSDPMEMDRKPGSENRKIKIDAGERSQTESHGKEI